MTVPTPQQPGRASDAATRDSNAGRADSLAPTGPLTSISRPHRPPYRADEGEADRGEWWSLAKALLIVLLVLAGLAGIGTQVVSLVRTGDTSPPILSWLFGSST